jgi:polysaccharide pyruvyl transferase CsaB
MLEVIAKKLKEEMPGSGITVMSNAPGTEAYRTVDRKSLIKVLHAVARCDVLVFGGGSIFQDATSFASLLYYCSLCFFARLFGKKYILAYQGMGPLSKRISICLMRKVLSYSSFCSFRDKDSFDWAKELGAKEPRLTSDPVFLLCEKRTGGEANHSIKKVAFILKALPLEMSESLISAALRMKADHATRIFHISLFPLQDDQICSEFAEQTNSQELCFDTVEELVSLLADMDVVISARYHGAVFSLCAGTNCIPVSCDPKMSSLAKEFGIKVFDDDWAVTIETLYDVDIMGRVDLHEKRAQEGMEELIRAVLDVCVREEKGK